MLNGSLQGYSRTVLQDEHRNAFYRKTYRFHFPCVYICILDSACRIVRMNRMVELYPFPVTVVASGRSPQVTLLPLHYYAIKRARAPLSVTQVVEHTVRAAPTVPMSPLLYLRWSLCLSKEGHWHPLSGIQHADAAVTLFCRHFL